MAGSVRGLILTIGTFDLFHIGHLNLLLAASRYGTLHVGVNSDRFVSQYKGRAPVFPEEHRLRIVAALRCVQQAHLNDGPGRELIEQLHPQVVAVGSDWHERGYLAQIDVTQAYLEQQRISVLYLPRTPGVSTTDLRGDQ